MRNPVLVTLLAIALLGAAIGVSPLVSAEDSEPGAPVERSSSFPEDWTGTWKGELEISLAGGKGQALPMTLTVGPAEDGGRQWAITYGEQPTREYRLKAVEAEQGRFEIDEQNGIVLPAQRFGNELVSSFAVSGNRLTATYRLVDETLEFRIIVTSAGAAGTTGGEGQAPEVAFFEARSLHRATLRREE